MSEAQLLAAELHAEREARRRLEERLEEAESRLRSLQEGSSPPALWQAPQVLPQSVAETASLETWLIEARMSAVDVGQASPFVAPQPLAPIATVQAVQEPPSDPPAAAETESLVRKLRSELAEARENELRATQRLRDLEKRVTEIEPGPLDEDAEAGIDLEPGPAAQADADMTLDAVPEAAEDTVLADEGSDLFPADRTAEEPAAASEEEEADGTEALAEPGIVAPDAEEATEDAKDSEALVAPGVFTPDEAEAEDAEDEISGALSVPELEKRVHDGVQDEITGDPLSAAFGEWGEDKAASTSQDSVPPDSLLSRLEQAAEEKKQRDEAMSKLADSFRRGHMPADTLLEQDEETPEIAIDEEAEALTPTTDLEPVDGGGLFGEPIPADDEAVRAGEDAGTLSEEPGDSSFPEQEPEGAQLEFEEQAEAHSPVLPVATPYPEHAETGESDFTADEEELLGAPVADLEAAAPESADAVDQAQSAAPGMDEALAIWGEAGAGEERPEAVPTEDEVCEEDLPETEFDETTQDEEIPAASEADSPEPETEGPPASEMADAASDELDAADAPLADPEAVEDMPLEEDLPEAESLGAAQDEEIPSSSVADLSEPMTEEPFAVEMVDAGPAELDKAGGFLAEAETVEDAADPPQAEFEAVTPEEEAPQGEETPQDEEAPQGEEIAAALVGDLPDLAPEEQDALDTASEAAQGSQKDAAGFFAGLSPSVRDEAEDASTPRGEVAGKDKTGDEPSEALKKNEGRDAMVDALQRFMGAR